MKLKLALVQADLMWENPEGNMAHLSELISTQNFQPHIIVLPEMFSTGFTMLPANISPVFYEKTIAWMQELSIRYGSAVCGSIIAPAAGGKFTNRFIWVNNKEIQSYDKRHLFTMAGEHQYYQAGSHNIRLNCQGWVIQPQICYDARFPVWSRNTRNDPYDILLYVANWPKPRIHAWKSLLLARGIENQCYVVGVNRVGIDGQNIAYNGQSQVSDPYGQILVESGGGLEEVIEISLEKESLIDFRNKFPVLNDMDNFTLKVD